MVEKNNRLEGVESSRLGLSDVAFKENITEKIHALIRINESLSKQLIDLQSKMIFLEKKSADIANTNQGEDKEKTITPEQALAQQESEFDFFQEAYDRIYLEAYDPFWDAQMHTSFEAIETRLRQLNVGAMELSDSECRSNTCRVEFTYGDEAIDLNIISALIAAPGSSQVLLKHIDEGETKKTIAVYTR